MNKVLVVCGPTATGKTRTGVFLAKKYNGEIVSADSRQVYRHMDIGTGKDVSTKKCVEKMDISYQGKRYEVGAYKKDSVLVWMLDVIDPDQRCSVHLYQNLATQVIETIYNKGKLPIVVGGTGLYIQSLYHPIDIAVPPNDSLRNELSKWNVQDLTVKLQEVDSNSWKAMNSSDKKNSRRLIRRIEIALSGEKRNEAASDRFNMLKIGLYCSMDVLQKKICDRVEERVGMGIKTEIEQLLAMGYGWENPSMSSLGYRQWKPYFCNEQTEEDVIRLWKREEYKYARRQMTWFKKDMSIRWFDIEKQDVFQQIESLVASWYTVFCHGIKN